MTLLLFDIDGTLMASSGAGMRALGRAMRQVTGLDLSLLGVIPDGKTDPVIAREAFELGGLVRGAWEQAEVDLWRCYPGYLREELALCEARLRLMPGVVTLLEQLQSRQHCALGLLTGNLEVTARLKLESLGLNRFFPIGAYGSDSPEREQLGHVALRRAREYYRRDFTGPNVWLVGDTQRDIQAARAIQARVLAVATGRYSSAQLSEFMPDALLEDLAEVPRVLSLLGV